MGGTAVSIFMILDKCCDVCKELNTNIALCSGKETFMVATCFSRKEVGGH